MDGSVETALAGFAYEEPFASLLGSHKGSMVEVTGQYSNSLGKVLQELLRSPRRSPRELPANRDRSPRVTAIGKEHRRTDG